MRRQQRRNEQHFIRLVQFQNLLCDKQMAIVDRIERASEHRNALFPRIRQRLFGFFRIHSRASLIDTILRLFAFCTVVFVATEAAAWRTVETIAVSVTVKTTTRPIITIAFATVKTTAWTIKTVTIPSAETIMARPRIF